MQRRRPDPKHSNALTPEKALIFRTPKDNIPWIREWPSLPELESLNQNTVTIGNESLIQDRRQIAVPSPREAP